VVWAEFENWKMRNFLGCAATTSSAIGKWRLRLDSSRQVGLETALEGVLIVGVGCCAIGGEGAGGIFHPQKWELFWLV